MFEADTPLVFDALQMATLAAFGGAGIVFLIQKRARNTGTSQPRLTYGKGDLETRIRVLERIATDRSIELAAEIEGLQTERVRGTPDPYREQPQ